MLPLFWLFFGEIWVNTLSKKRFVFWKFGFDNSGSNSAQESSPNEKSIYSLDENKYIEYK